MQKVLLIPFLLLPILINAQDKNFARLNKIYESGQLKKLDKKARKLISSDSRNPVGHYFEAVFLCSQYKATKVESSLLRASSKMKRALQLDKSSKLTQEMSAFRLELEACLKAKTALEKEQNKTKAKRFYKALKNISADTVELYGLLFNPAELPKAKSFFPKQNVAAKNKRDSIIQLGVALVGTPYVWAGESPKGFDCSGFVKYLYAQVGIKLPHNANKISYLGSPVSSENAAPGDVILFGTMKDTVHRAYHAGIIYSNDGGELQVIHCVSKGVHVSTNYDQYWKERTMMITNIVDTELHNLASAE